MKTHGKKVIVRQDLSKTQTDGGIALPDTMQQKLPLGTVVGVGEQVQVVKAGDRVQFNGYSGSTITVKGQDYLVLDQEDILVVLGEDDA